MSEYKLEEVVERRYNCPVFSAWYARCFSEGLSYEETMTTIAIEFSKPHKKMIDEQVDRARRECRLSSSAAKMPNYS